MIAELLTIPEGLQISYFLEDPDGLVILTDKSKEQSLRQNNIWKNTCFELFLSQESEKSYWEFNFAPDGRWNLYYFADYRQPQPPRESFDFELLSQKWSGNRLEVILKTKLSLKKTEACLCAVIESKTKGIHYFSTHHQISKPDFHARSSIDITLNESRRTT